MNHTDRLLERFIRYTKVDTTAVDDAQHYPSSAGQFELGKIILEEMRQMGIDDATQDERGIVMGTVMGTIPASAGNTGPTIALCSHFDTSPETSGKNVQAQIISNYQGGDIQLPGNASQVILVRDNPELNDLSGKTIITTDGTTLLGADDKAGLAVILEMAQQLLEQPNLEHGPIRLCFTCDEEIGHGVDYVDLEKVDSVVCYTLDGPGAGEIDIETFSADLSVVTIEGINIHPSIAKNRMVNALRIAAEFISQMPSDHLSPETTSDREGFLHPYIIEGGVEQVKIKILLRDFDNPKLIEYAQLLEDIASATTAKFPGCKISVNTHPQYRNMADVLKKEPRAAGIAEQAHKNLGFPYETALIRGGTDGSRFSELGLPTPNLSTGQHNPHSPLEWACLEEMHQAVAVLKEIAKLWGKEK